MVNNSLLVDINSFKYEVFNRTRGRLRIYLGEYRDGDFIITINTIKDLEESFQTKLRSVIKSIILSDFTIIF